MFLCLAATQSPRSACMELWALGGQMPPCPARGRTGERAGMSCSALSPTECTSEEIPQFFPTTTYGLPVRAVCRCVNTCEPQILCQVGSRRGCEDLPCSSVFFPIFSSSLLNSRKSRMEKNHRDTFYTSEPFLH